jgi:hypothetical protein
MRGALRTSATRMFLVVFMPYLTTVGFCGFPAPVVVVTGREHHFSGARQKIWCEERISYARGIAGPQETT